MIGQGHENAFEEFREGLRGALDHLRVLSFDAPAVVFEIVGCDPRQGCGPLQEKIATAITDLDPGPDGPPDSHARRHFDSLRVRFLAGLTQEETAECLHLSVRHVQRVQAEAIHILARRLWAGWLASRDVTDLLSQAPDWRAQTELELALLLESAPNEVANVSQAIHAVLALWAAAAAQYSFHAEAGFIPPDLLAAIHPSVLRQTLITAIGQLARHLSPGQTTVHTTLEDGKVRISFSAPVGPGHDPTSSDLLSEIITPPGSTVEVHRKADHLFLWIKVPSVGERTIVVVEDNVDMVHFYRRCTAGTTYRIVHAVPDEHIIESIEAAKPDIVVLDVMLPEVDGWQLLTHLHERPATRPIPVIVCSVVKEDQLALALGAALFLAKPIQPRRFVEALDQVTRRASA